MEDSLYLCFIERLYNSPKGEKVFRFYFCNEDDIDEVVGENWDIYCSDAVKPPYPKYVNETYLIKTKRIDMETLSENEFFTYIDGVDGIIALAWETSEDEIPDKRLVFHFNETLESVKNKFASKEIVFKLED